MISRRVVLTAAREFLDKRCLIHSVSFLTMFPFADKITDIAIALLVDSSQDCVFNDSDGGATIKASRVVKLNMYDYDDQTDVVTIKLCTIKGGGDNCLADSAYAVYHENYDNVSFDNDFALIFLPDISAVNEGFVAEINPVKLNSDANVPADGEQLEVFGWGATTFEANWDDIPKVPNTVILQYVPDDQCEAAWGCEIFDSMLCAIADGQAVGNGDSGKQKIVPEELFLLLTC